MVDLSPKWAKAAALLGLEIQITMARGPISNDLAAAYRKRLQEIEDMK